MTSSFIPFICLKVRKRHSFVGVASLIKKGLEEMELSATGGSIGSISRGGRGWFSG